MLDRKNERVVPRFMTCLHQGSVLVFRSAPAVASAPVVVEVGLPVEPAGDQNVLLSEGFRAFNALIKTRLSYVTDEGAQHIYVFRTVDAVRNTTSEVDPKSNQGGAQLSNLSIFSRQSHANQGSGFARSLPQRNKRQHICWRRERAFGPTAFEQQPSVAGRMLTSFFQSWRLLHCHHTSGCRRWRHLGSWTKCEGGVPGKRR